MFLLFFFSLFALILSILYWNIDLDFSKKICKGKLCWSQLDHVGQSNWGQHNYSEFFLMLNRNKYLNMDLVTLFNCYLDGFHFFIIKSCLGYVTLLSLWLWKSIFSRITQKKIDKHTHTHTHTKLYINIYVVLFHD